jgi:CubicO group peptidase (beta-lactamase class C family)
MQTLLRTALLIVIGFTLTNCNDSSNSTNPIESTQPETGIAGDGNLLELLKFYKKAHDVPAITSVIFSDNVVLEMAAYGERKVGHKEPVSIEDKWYIGSLTKAITASLVARLVEQGVLRWDTTIIEVYPELNGVILEAYHNIRIDQLLSHTGGIIEADEEEYAAFLGDVRSLPEQRHNVVLMALTTESEISVGSYHYSNIGYIIAGAVLEKLSGRSFEDMMITELFLPLGMNSTGFGAVGDSGSLLHPWGHHFESGIWVPVDPSVEHGNKIPVASPAGSNLYTTHSDYALFIKEHLNGLSGKAGLLSVESHRKLHTPFPDSQYALGWFVTEINLEHDGSDDNWYAEVHLFPSKNSAFFSVTNSDSEQSRSCINKILDISAHRMVAYEEQERQ